jgi:thymidylate synthase/dihydrofolate reductase
MEKKNPDINFILAVGTNGLIGVNGHLPWHIKDELNNFKKLTLNSKLEFKNVMIMGKNTFKSIGSKPLVGRTNIVLTSQYESEKNQPNLVFLSNLQNALYYAKMISTENIWIIGGLSLYEQIHLICPKNIYLTQVCLNETALAIINTDKTNQSFLSDGFFEFLEENYTKICVHSGELLDTQSQTMANCIFYNYTKKISESYSEIENNLYQMSNMTTNTITNSEENEYLNLLKDCIINGDFRKTRNEYTWSIFGADLKFNVKNKFPLLTSKKVPLRLIFEELMFFIRGYTDNEILRKKNIHIWDQNTTSEFINSNNKQYEKSTENLMPNDMGPMYGFQWRYFNAKYDRASNESSTDHYKSIDGVDQLQNVINLLKTDPFSRRIIMTTYNPVQADFGVLYPCHSLLIQFHVKLSMLENRFDVSIKMTQRSADLFLGLPFNIASTALLLYLICDHLNMSESDSKYIYEPDKVIISLGDCHIYQSHLDSILTQLQSEVNLFPTLQIKKGQNKLVEYEFENILLQNYHGIKTIKAHMIA